MEIDENDGSVFITFLSYFIVDIENILMNHWSVYCQIYFVLSKVIFIIIQQPSSTNNSYTGISTIKNR
jgi:hypothetical protein